MDSVENGELRATLWLGGRLNEPDCLKLKRKNVAVAAISEREKKKNVCYRQSALRLGQEYFSIITLLLLLL